MILPRWVLRAGWAIHRGLYRVSGGRAGLQRPSDTKLGTLRLHTRGRRSGEPRTSFLFYVEDGGALAIVASNAGDDREPAWWLNLRAQPETTVELDPTYTEYASATQRPIDVVMLEPLQAPGSRPRDARVDRPSTPSYHRSTAVAAVGPWRRGSTNA